MSLNIKNICRACLTENDNLIPVDEIFLKHYNLLTNLSIDLSDSLPRKTCQACLDTVMFFSKFREACISNEAILQASLMHQNVKCKNETELSSVKNKDLKKSHPEIKTEDFADGADDNYEYDDNNSLILDPEPIIIKSKCLRKKIKIRKDDVKEEPQELHCGLCTKTLTGSVNLKSHLENHAQEKKCSICEETCSSWSQLFSHRIVHLPRDERYCHICTAKFTSCLKLETDRLQKHYVKKHFIDGVAQQHRCHLCNLKFITKKKLNNHMSHTHSNNVYICDICSKTFKTKDAMKSHLQSHMEKRFSCDKCYFKCKFIGGLKDHHTRKHSTEKVNCKTCDRAFSNQDMYDKHICNTTTRKMVRLKLCPICGVEVSRLNRHMESHKSVGSYRCDRCPATYKSQLGLTVHRNRHDGVRTHRCEHCPAAFYSHNVLTKHRRRHTGEKPYVCKVCNKGFAGNHNLKVHMQIHGEYLIKKKPVENTLHHAL